MSGRVYVDCFAGLGGWPLGAYWAGWKFDHHYFSEVEKYPFNVYKLRFPDAVALGDIRRIDSARLLDRHVGSRFVLSGSFPCQNLSVAGKREGIYGQESSLWFEYARLIRELRPEFAFVENVGNLSREGLHIVLADLFEAGYNAEWQCLYASDVGAPHRRERIWIVAYPFGSGWKRGAYGCGGEGEVHSGGYEAGIFWGADSAFLAGSSYGSADVADTDSGSAGRVQLFRGREEHAEQAGVGCGGGCEEADVAYSGGERSQGAARVELASGAGESGLEGSDADTHGARCEGVRDGSSWDSFAGSLGRSGWGGAWGAESQPEPLAYGVPVGVGGDGGGHVDKPGKVKYRYPANRNPQLRAYGNAIVPQIAELLWARVLWCLDNGWEFGGT